MGKRLLLCTDMDRTVIPNGQQTEWPGARERLNALVEQEGVELAYVTGRDLALVQQALSEYALPQPHYAITDVGTHIHAIRAADEGIDRDWQDTLAREWQELDRDAMIRQLDPEQKWRYQEESKQGRFKISFYTAADELIGRRVVEQIAAAGWPAQAIWSVDEASGTGLLDILPACANKYLAISFLQERCGYLVDEVVFAGDSGNDIDALVSPLPAVLVGNATESIRNEAIRRAQEAGAETGLYFAKAPYADGVLEGVAHYRKGEFEMPAAQGRGESGAVDAGEIAENEGDRL